MIQYVKNSYKISVTVFLVPEGVSGFRKSAYTCNRHVLLVCTSPSIHRSGCLQKGGSGSLDILLFETAKKLAVYKVKLGGMGG